MKDRLNQKVGYYNLRIPNQLSKFLRHHRESLLVINHYVQKQFRRERIFSQVIQILKLNQVIFLYLDFYYHVKILHNYELREKPKKLY